MIKLIPGVARVFILAVAALSLAACASGPTGSVRVAAEQAIPPTASAPEAATFVWQPTINFQVQVDRGFDAEGRLRPDGKATYLESAGVAQISGRCAVGIQDAVRGIGWFELKRTLRGGGAQAVGSLVGTFLGFESPTDLLIRQVTGLTAGTAFFAAWDAADFQLYLILSSAHAQCVSDRVKKNRGLLHDVIIVMTPGLQGAPMDPMAPGIKLVVPSDDYNPETGEVDADKPTGTDT